MSVIYNRRHRLLLPKAVNALVLLARSFLLSQNHPRSLDCRLLLAFIALERSS